MQDEMGIGVKVVAEAYFEQVAVTFGAGDHDESVVSVVDSHGVAVGVQDVLVVDPVTTRRRGDADPGSG